MATTALKPKAYPGVQLLAAASIEANSVEQALRGAQFRFDRALHDRRLPAAPPLATAGQDYVLGLIAEARKVEAAFDAAAAAAIEMETDPARAAAHMRAAQLADASISASHRVMGATPCTLAGLGKQLLYAAEYCCDGSFYLFAVAVQAARLLGCADEPSRELARLIDEWPV
jgi:hypothetical protein